MNRQIILVDTLWSFLSDCENTLVCILAFIYAPYHLIFPLENFHSFYVTDYFFRISLVTGKLIQNYLYLHLFMPTQTLTSLMYSAQIYFPLHKHCYKEIATKEENELYFNRVIIFSNMLRLKGGGMKLIIAVLISKRFRLFVHTY